MNRPTDAGGSGEGEGPKPCLPSAPMGCGSGLSLRFYTNTRVGADWKTGRE